MKFLIPFSVLVSFGSRFQWRTIVLSESAGAFTAPDRLVLSTVLALLRKGATVPVEAWARDNSVRLATGVLTATDNQIDTTTGTLRLKAVFDNRDHALFPNQFVNVRLFITP
jgi:multidrug efflux system membrane fusion protein